MKLVCLVRTPPWHRCLSVSYGPRRRAQSGVFEGIERLGWMTGFQQRGFGSYQRVFPPSWFRDVFGGFAAPSGRRVLSDDEQFVSYWLATVGPSPWPRKYHEASVDAEGRTRHRDRDARGRAFVAKLSDEALEPLLRYDGILRDSWVRALSPD
jgi:hypothetical protein